MESTENYVPVTYEKNNLLAHINETIANFPDRPAVISGDGKVRLTYKEVNERANRLANALLNRGIKKGDRVAIFQTNTWQYAEQYLAILKIGAICVPMNFRLRGPEALFIITEAGAKALLFEERYLPIFETIRPYILSVERYICTIGKTPDWAEDYETIVEDSTPEEVPEVELDLDSIAAISFTSGTTGLPKGSTSTHGNVMVNLYDTMFEELIGRHSLHPEWGYALNLINVPIYHIGGVLFLYLGMAKGSTLVIPEAFTPQSFLDIVEREQVTITYLVPTMFAMILDLPAFKRERIRSLKFIPYGAMPMPPDLLKRIMVEFPTDIKFTDAFGCTECNAATICKMPEDHDLTGTEEEVNKKIERLKGVGRPLNIGIETKIIDEQGNEVPPGVVGEVTNRGQKVTPGYWRNAERTEESFDEEGWFHTGDMASRDVDGYVYFADRKKDMINRGGENIYPIEVERVLLLHPKVQDAAVFAVPDPKWGHIVKAAVVLEEGDVDEKELTKFCKERLASFKCPSSMHFMKELPRSFEGGKVLRRVLREQFAPLFP